MKMSQRYDEEQQQLKKDIEELQRQCDIVIHYNFIGVLDMPEVEEYPNNVVLDSRQGVAVEYLVGKAG